MKKILYFVSAIALLCAFTITANAKIIGSGEYHDYLPESSEMNDVGSTSIDATVGTTSTETSYNITLEWGSMTFDYSKNGDSYAWMPTTDEIVAGKTSIEGSNGESNTVYETTTVNSNYFTIRNSSNCDIKVAVAWTPTISGVTASYSRKTYEFVNGAATLVEEPVSGNQTIPYGAESYKYELNISGGNPEDIVAGAKIGSTTITISSAD